MIEKMLDDLAFMDCTYEDKKLAIEAEMENLIPVKVRAKIDALKATLDEIASQHNQERGILETSIKEATLQQGSTVKGESLMAVWNKGRVTWDTEKLDGYAAAHPEIMVFRKEGSPSVSIRSR